MHAQARTFARVILPLLLMAALLGWSAAHNAAAQNLPAATSQPATAPAATSQPASAPTTKAAGLPKTLTLNLGVKNGNKVNMKLTLIPAGRFMMGSPADEKGRQKNETLHEVTISKPFYMGVIEVTWDQFEVVAGFYPNSFWLPKDPPLETATWEEADAFCKKLSAKVGRIVRLPTEAEWEYACRAGTTTAFNTGAELTTDQANLMRKYDERTSQCGKFKPNAWGLYDMHGNVQEWCADWYGEYPTGPVTDPKGPATGETHVVRGGSWSSEDASSCRSAFRDWQAPDYRCDNTGFRVVAEAR